MDYTNNILISIGITQNGKSLFCNYLYTGCVPSFECQKFAIGDGLKSKTKTIQSQVFEYEHVVYKNKYYLSKENADEESTKIKTKIQIVDTPGLGDTENNDEEMIKSFYKFIRKEEKSIIVGFILIIKYPNLFDDKCMENLYFYKEIMKLLNIKNLYLVITDCSTEKIRKESKIKDVNATFEKIEQQVFDIFQVRIDSFKIDLLYDDGDNDDTKNAVFCRRSILNSCLNNKHPIANITQFPKPRKWIFEDNQKIECLRYKNEGLRDGITIGDETLKK